MQHKIYFAVHRHTATELIYERVDAGKEHMGLTSWASMLGGKMLKADVALAKNYLSDEELCYLEWIMSLHLDYAEMQVDHITPWSKRARNNCGELPDALRAMQSSQE